MALATVSNSHELMQSQNGLWKIFRGTSAQIINSGLARGDQFPGAPGRGKTTATYYDGEPSRPGAHHPRDEKYLSIRRLKKDNFVVYIGYSENELDAWLKEQDRAIQRQLKEDAYLDAKRSADRELAYLTMTKEQFFAKHLALFPELIELQISHLGHSEYRGFSFSPKTLNEMRVAAMGMYAALQRGEVIFDKATHDAREKAIKAELAKFDPARPALRLVHTS